MPAQAESVDLDKVSTGFVIATGAPATSYGLPIALHGDSVTSHGLGPHIAATIIASQTKYKVNGKNVCRIGDSATCGHTIAAGVGNLQTVLVGD
jgi:uncharacterized Zn-binding protein involved in type VI secretion